MPVSGSGVVRRVPRCGDLVCDKTLVPVTVGGYSADHPVIRVFWRVVEGFTDEEKRKLLKFVTSCSRPPLLGFKVRSVCAVRLSAGQAAGRGVGRSDVVRCPQFSGGSLYGEVLVTAAFSVFVATLSISAASLRYWLFSDFTVPVPRRRAGAAAGIGAACDQGLQTGGPWAGLAGMQSTISSVVLLN